MLYKYNTYITPCRILGFMWFFDFIIVAKDFIIVAKKFARRF
jgi:hypothetical protein